MNKRLLSMFLALCMIVTMLPVTALAEEIHTTIGGSGEIISFAPLTETAKAASLGTSIEDLELPETLTATVRTAVPADENPVQDSGSPETATPTTAAEPEWKETTGDIPVTWTSEPEYDMAAEGEYVFTPVIEGYTVRAELPELTVTVGEMPLIAAARGSVTPMSITNYGIWVGGVQVTSANVSNVLDDDGTVTYNPTDGILTLNGAVITDYYTQGNYDYGIYHSNSAMANNLIINLVGENTIMLVSRSSQTVTGIWSDKTEGSLTFCETGNGSLDISAPNVVIYGESAITISSGTINATGGITGIYSKGQMTINGGNVTADGTSIGIACGNALIISGGTVAALSPEGYGVNVSHAPTVTGGTLTAIGQMRAIILDSDPQTLSVSAGMRILTSTNDEGSHASVYNNENISSYKHIMFEPATSVAQIGSTDYATLQQAVDSATEGQTIKIVADITITAAIQVNTTRSFTLDLNGHSISCSNAVSTIVKAGEGTLTITDSQENGAIVGNTGAGASTVHVLAGALIINGGTISQGNANNRVIHNGDSSETQCGTVEIRGGTINGTVSNAGNLTITDGTIDGAAGVAIYNHEIASVSGGTITSNSIITLSNTADASLTITGGTISNSCTTGAYGAILNMSEVFISGGTIDGSGSGRKGISNYGTTSTVTIYAPSAGKSIVIKGNAKVIDSFGTFTVPSSGATITGSTNYDGTDAETYNASNLASYKYIKVEPTATLPVLSAGNVNRTSNTAATIDFTTDKAGTAYYLVMNSGATPPPASIGVKVAGTSLGAVSAGTVTNQSVTLTAGAKDIYVVVEDSAGNISTPLKIEATAYAKETPTTSDLVYSLTAVDYDGTAKPVSVTAASGKNLGAITVIYNDSSTASPINAGTYTVKVNIAGSAEYNAATGLSLGSYTINKVVYTGTTTVLASVLVSGQTGATVTLPALPIGASYGSPTSGGAITMTNMSVAGNTLTYTAPASTAEQTGTMTIPVTGATNYNDYSVVVTVTYTAKTPQVISYANATVAKTYGDTKFVNTLTQTAVNGAITYESDDTSVATVNATTGEVTIVSVGNGSATITATAAETSSHAQVTASYTVTVSKKALTLKAEDKNMTKGDALPTFTYTATGLVNGDTVTTAPTMSTTADGTAIGTFDITISGGVVANAASYTITYTKGILTVTAVPNYTVTFNPNGGTVSETSRSVAPGTAVGSLPIPTRSGSYSFDGWYTAASGGTQISASTTVSADVTYYAHWTYTGGGGSGSGGGSSSNDNSSPVIVTPPAPDKPNSPTQGEIKVSGTVDSKGNVTVNISDKTVTDAFEKALVEARKNGNEQNGITVVLHVDAGSKTGSNVTVNLPKTVQDTIIEKKIVNTIVVVDNPDIRIGMNLATVQEINKQAKSDVNITATRTDSGKLTSEAKKAIGSRPVFDLKVNYGNGKAVSSFGSGSVSVTIPYTLGSNEKAGNVQAVYVDSKGKVHWLVNSVYDSVEKVLRFSTDHFSTYGIGYKQTGTAFTDIAGHWAKEDIEFVASRGLFSGTSETKFSPNTAMTRGMFVTALGRLANADVSGYAKSSFSDVKDDAYYMGYIEWASKNNIVNGVGNGKFAPDQSITREQMAVIMSNYAKTIGCTLPKVHVENIFADNGKISTYAKEAVKQMQMAGVISGKNGNLYDPQGTATRAEVSAVLRRFVELVISSDTAQGWSMNDSGKWMYFKDGKPLTGKQDIDGATYTFDQYGVTADVPKNLRYTTYTVQKGDSFWSISRKLGCPMSELERLNNKSRFSLILPGGVLRIPEK